MTDVCVIGSGPAGSIAAFELASRGMNVTVLERGAYVPASEQQLGRPSFGWDSATEVAPRPAVAGELQRLTPTMVGGGGEIFGGAAHRMLPDDFRMLAARGAYPGAEVADWPWSYDELEPYYTRVEDLLGVSGTAEGTLHAVPRSKPFPHPALDADSDATRRLDRAARELGWHARPTPLALLSRPQADRGACVGCGFCAGLPCLYGAKGSPTQTTLRAALATGRCRVIPRVTAHRLVLDGERAVAVEYSDERGGKRRLDAEIFVVAGGAIESPRLLLLSRGERFADGLGNHSGLLGRFFCSHATPRTIGVFDRPTHAANTHYVVRSIDDLYFGRPPLWKGGLLQLHLVDGIQSVLANDPRARFERPGQVPLAHEIGRRLMVYFIGDVLPQRGNRVALSHRLDRFGYPLARIEFTFHPADVTTGGMGAAAAGSLLAAMGANEVNADTGWINSWGVGYHFSGTCRAGRDPARSVVDEDCRVHDCANVFVCDASVFPTSGGVNPVLTVQASALRVADRLASAR